MERAARGRKWRSPFDSFFGIHELGLEPFHPFGLWLHMADGTLAQLGAALVGLVMFRRHDTTLVAGVHDVAVATMALGLGFGAWLIVCMLRSRAVR